MVKTRKQTTRIRKVSYTQTGLSPCQRRNFFSVSLSQTQHFLFFNQQPVRQETFLQKPMSSTSKHLKRVAGHPKRPSPRCLSEKAVPHAPASAAAPRNSFLSLGSPTRNCLLKSRFPSQKLKQLSCKPAWGEK